MWTSGGSHRVEERGASDESDRTCSLRACFRAGGRRCGIGFRQARLPFHALRRLSSEGRRGLARSRPAGCLSVSGPQQHDLERVRRRTGGSGRSGLRPAIASVVPNGARLGTGYVYQRLTRQGVRLSGRAPGDRPIRAQPQARESAGTAHGSATRFGEVIDWSRSTAYPRPTHRGINTSPTRRRPRRRRSRRSRNSWPTQQVASGEPRGRTPDTGVRAGSLPARRRSGISRSLKLPAPARRVLVQYKQLKRRACQS